MHIYLLLLKPDAPADKDLACLAGRFDWFAFLLPPFWAITHSLWRELVLMIAALVAVLIVENFFALPSLTLYFLFALWLGFEASFIRARSLERKGWQHQMDLIASDRLMAESRFWQQQQSQSGKKQ